MLRWILITVLTIGIAGVAFWGYQEHREKNAILIQAENTYQRSFHNLSYHMDILNDKIGTALAMNSKDSLSPQLIEIWRITSDAMADVSQLPLSLLPFNKTEEFLSKIGDFTYRTAVRDLGDNPLTDKELDTLEKLYSQSGDITKDLREVQHVVLDHNLRWMDVQLALADSDEQSDNTIIDGFKTVEKKVGNFAEENVNSPLQGPTVKDHPYKFLTGSKIGKQEAIKMGKNMLHVSNEQKLSITQSGKGADVPMYSISYQDKDKSAYMDVSQKGGKPLSLIVHRPVNQQKLSLNDGLNKAIAYLKDNDYKHMSIFQSDQYDNVGVYSFLYDDGGVRVYSDSIDVKVALDNGDIIGFTSKNYFMNHRDRKIPKPKITEADARKKVNENVTINERHLAVIDNKLGEEVLTYEFLGVLDNDTYRIFINAMDGTEEKVEKLKGKEMKFVSSF